MGYALRDHVSQTKTPRFQANCGFKDCSAAELLGVCGGPDPDCTEYELMLAAAGRVPTPPHVLTYTRNTPFHNTSFSHVKREHCAHLNLLVEKR